VGALRTYAVNARDLPGRIPATTRPGGLASESGDQRSGDHDEPHEDTAQRSAYEVLAGGSIEPGYSSVSEW
jgi:hypothetical protein